jgi:hypothetical protein
MIAWLSFDTACELGFRGSLDEWERLMGSSCETVNDRSTPIALAAGTQAQRLELQKLSSP